MENGMQMKSSARPRSSRIWAGFRTYDPHDPAVQVARSLMGAELCTSGYRAERLLVASRPRWVPVCRDGGRVEGQASINMMTARRAKDAAVELVKRWCDTLSRNLTVAGIPHTVGWVETREQHHVEQTQEGQSAGRVFVVTARIVLS